MHTAVSVSGRSKARQKDAPEDAAQGPGKVSFRRALLQKVRLLRH